MEHKRILVVDDDSLVRDSIVEVLSRKGYAVVSAASGPDGCMRLREHSFDLIMSDMKMPGMTGIEFLEQVHADYPDIPFLIMTAYGDIATAVDAMKKGARDYLLKSDIIGPDNLTELELTVERLLEFGAIVAENRSLRSALRKQWDYVGNSSAIGSIREMVLKIAPSRSTVLVTGESGTGKELVARSIHLSSPRAQGPFVKINCAALPEGLIESELFGHEKGAFTGAIRQKLGKFELAHTGTLLLDEIGEMPAAVQAKLLRVLQEREISKVGGDDAVAVDVRVVATTNRDLEREVAEGRFREDLYYRLNVIHLVLPPLRERLDDLEPLMVHFIAKYNQENGFSAEMPAPEIVSRLREYPWPGNIRELENTVERAVVLTRSGPIAHDLLAKKSPAGPRQGDIFSGFKPGVTVAEAERELILKTLESCGGNRTRAAAALDISIRTLRNKLHEYGVASTGADAE